MKPNNLATEEFTFVRDRLKKLAELLITLDSKNLMEAAFLVGCLHNVCHENSIKFKEYSDVM